LPESEAGLHARCMPRRRHCEVCQETLGKGSPFIECGDRRVFLCAAHQQVARQAGAATTEALCELFKESSGRRSLLGRRTNERRLFPPRPEGRRHQDGRRSIDRTVSGVPRAG